ncbi:MAG: hypothetical protein ABI851_15955 [Saprospiraceae bacterium]
MVKLYLISILLLLIGVVSCITPRNGTTKINKIKFIVRDEATNKLLDSVQIKINSKTISTNSLGYAEIKFKKAVDTIFSKDTSSYINYSKVCDGVKFEGRFRFNKLLDIYSLYLSCGKTDIKKEIIKLDSSNMYADMHYHASLKSYNYFGQELYRNNKLVNVPDNLLWFKNIKGLEVFLDGSFCNTYLGKYKNENCKKYYRMRLLLNNAVYPKNAMNSLTRFTEATNDHRKEGNVYLAYNSISPFEPGVANSRNRQIANRFFVTGASKQWLDKIGYFDDTDGYLTPWRNFNNEFKLIISQSKNTNYYNWNFYRNDCTMNEQPLLLNVIEGGHIFQNDIFPVSLVYNLDRLDNDETNRVYSEIYDYIIDILKNCKKNKLSTDYCGNYEFTRLVDKYIDFRKFNILDPISNHERTFNYIKARISVDPTLSLIEKKAFIHDFLSVELVQNIDSLKRLGDESERIRMITISHFTYNGLLGQANPLDGGKFINNLMARKSYAIRVSDDHSYLNQWSGAFFSIPGVTELGKLAMRRLLDDSFGCRILIDLKHTDFVGRTFFYDSLMVKHVIPPICSHCAANGLPSYMYSPAINEYMYTKTKSVNRFYPFQINLYNDEIPVYFKNGGIIGLVFEERALGSYIKGEITRSTIGEEKIKRNKFLKSVILYRDVETANLDILFKQYDKALVFRKDKSTLNLVKTKQRDRKIYNAIYLDYKKIEPFLNNLFYFIDNSGIGFDEKTGIDSAWMQLCIGSDLDGMIDPIDVCCTSSRFPMFKKMLMDFIPMFLEVRNLTNYRHPSKNTENSYFKWPTSKDVAMNYLFYTSLKNFTLKYMK